MYKVIKRTSDSLKLPCDYLFYKFDKFYNLLPLLSLPLFGVYKVNIISDDISSIQKFVKDEDKYSHLDITVISDPNVIKYMAERNQDLKVESDSSQWGEYSRLVLERGINFDKGVMSLVYSSIDHDLISLMDTMDLIVDKFPMGSLVTKSELSNHMLFREIVYPKQVLDKFIKMDRYRWKTLEKCEKSIAKEIITFSVAKNLRKYLKAKGDYLTTGAAPDNIINMNTGNMVLAYNTFVLDRNGISDPGILFRLYERGITIGGNI